MKTTTPIWEHEGPDQAQDVAKGKAVMADELMPCPFCGGAELSYGGSEHSEVFIVCDNCLAHGPHTGAEQGKAPDAPLWNKRQPLHTLAKALDDEAKCNS